MSDAVPSPPGRWHRAVPLLVLATVLVYCNSLTKAFVLDDAAWITDDPNPSDLGAYMMSPLGIRRPVVALTLALNYHIDPKNPVGYHVLNIAIHALAGLALFGVVRRTLLLERWSEYYRGSADSLAFAVALLWLVHPLETQSVTYVIQRCESLMGLFFLLTLYCSIRAWEGKPYRWGLAAILSCALGMGCKEMMALAPVMVILYDWTFRTERLWTILRRRWLLYLGLFGTIGVLYLEQRIGAEHHPSSAGMSFSMLYFKTQAGVLVHYLRLSVWPVGLCLDYYGWPMARSVSDWLAPGLVIVLLLLVTLWGVIRARWWGYAAAWFFIILGPTSSFILISDVAFEHRMYLSLAPIVLLVVLAGDALLRKLIQWRGWNPSAQHDIRGACLFLVAAGLGTLTMIRNEDYATAVRLYTDTVKKNPECAREMYNLAIFLTGEKPEEARATIERYLEFHPEDHMGWQILGQNEWDLGLTKKSIESMHRGQEKASDRHAYYLTTRGRGYAELGNLPKAIESYEQAVEKEPKVPHYRMGLAALLMEAGREEDAREQLRQAGEGVKDVAYGIARQARRQLLMEPRPGINHARRGLFEARQAHVADEDHPFILDTLAIAYAANERFTDARKTAQRALEQARARNETRLASDIQRRLRLFEKDIPYRLDTAHNQ